MEMIPSPREEARREKEALRREAFAHRVAHETARKKYGPNHPDTLRWQKSAKRLARLLRSWR